MFNKKYAVLLIVLLVVFVGLAMVAVSFTPSIDLFAFDFNIVPDGHICGSVCTV